MALFASVSWRAAPLPRDGDAVATLADGACCAWALTTTSASIAPNAAPRIIRGTGHFVGATLLQLASGLYALIARTAAAVPGPRSF